MGRKYHPCERCKSGVTASVLCHMCRRDDDVSASIRSCALCGAAFSAIGSGRNGSPYCSARCARLVGKAREKVISSVSTSVRRGELPKPSTLACVDCGGEAEQYDHREYLRPLSVDPVCRSCNSRRGPALDIVELVREHFGCLPFSESS